MESISRYVTPFLIGGSTVAGIRLASTYVSPQVAAVIGAAPIGLASTFYIEETPALLNFLRNYQIMLALLIAVSELYQRLLHGGVSHNVSLLTTFVVYILLVVMKTLLFPNMGGAPKEKPEKAV